MSDIQHPGGAQPDQNGQTPMQQQLATLPQFLPIVPPANPHNPVNNTPVLPENFQPPATATCDDTALRYTQTVRTQMAQNLMNTGAMTGNDVKQSQLLLTTLKDMDSAALSNKRIKADQAQTGALGDVSATVARLLQAVNPQSYGVNHGGQVVDVTAREVKQDPTAVAVPGEMAVNPSQMNYKDFTTKMRGGETPPPEN